MLNKLETLKDSLQLTVDAGVNRVDRIHQLIMGYAKARVDATKDGDVVPNAQEIYGLVRDINREIGEFATDLFEVAETASMRLQAAREAEGEEPKGE